MKFRLQCKRCGSFLTELLERVDEGFEPTWPDDENTIPQGRYWMAHEIEIERLKGHWFIHLEDRQGLHDHPDPRRHNGCCGKDGCDGPNQVCHCGAEVATEVSDCWTSFYVHFEPDAVTVVEVSERDDEPSGNAAFSPEGP